MKRFSVFEEIGKAKELSGTRDRYFSKQEDVITLATKEGGCMFTVDCPFNK